MYPRNGSLEPTRDTYTLCYEPTLSEGINLLEQLKFVVTTWPEQPENLEHIADFIEKLAEEVECVDKEFESDLQSHRDYRVASELRVVTEEQLQEAVKFLAGVWQGEITATMEQVAAARCFMRAE
jgi:hypothetical protein